MAKLNSADCKNLTHKNKFIPNCDLDQAQELLNEISALVDTSKLKASDISSSFYESCVYHISDFGILERYQHELHLYAFNALLNEDCDMNKFLVNVTVKSWSK